MMRFKPFLVMAAAAALFACNDDDNPVAPTASPPPTTAGAPDVLVRVAHLSPDAPAVDVLVDGEAVLTGVPFQAVSDYLELEAGTYRIQVTPAGNPSVSVIDAQLPLEANRVYTIAATGFLAGIQPLVLVDDLATGGSARIRAVHASPDAPPVDLALAGGDVLASGLTFRAASGYIEVPGGTYDLEVRLANTSTVVLPLPGVSVSGGTTYTAFVVGSAASATLAPVLVQDAP